MEAKFHDLSVEENMCNVSIQLLPNHQKLTGNMTDGKNSPTKAESR